MTNATTLYQGLLSLLDRGQWHSNSYFGDFTLFLVAGHWVGLSEGVAPSAGLQNRACHFRNTRLLS